MRSRPRRVVLLGLALVLLVAVGLASYGQVPAPAPSCVPGGSHRGMPRSGVYTGGQDGAGVDVFATWRRRPVQIVPQFPLWATWTDVEIPPSWLAYWSARHPRYQLAVRIAMMPQHSGVTLAKVATGRFDWRYRLAARHLVSAGLGDAVLRIGHEFNGEAYPWAAQGHAAAYAAAFQHIVRAMRSQPGEHFLFDWNVALIAHNWDATTAYPGDGYVDEIGVDLYDKHPGSAQTPGDRWNYLVAPTDGSRQGLDFWSKFAHDHGKPLAVPEWGLEATGDANGGGGGDDPTFIGHMAAWLKSHTVSWESYFNKNATDGTHRLDDFPNASAQYLACFGEPRPNAQPASSANRSSIVSRRNSTVVPSASTATTGGRGRRLYVEAIERQ